MSERKYGLVLDTSFIGGALQPAGTVLPGYGGPYGEAVKACDEKGNLLEAEATTEPQGGAVVKLFAAKHISRGDYVVEKIEDGSRASVVFKHTVTKGEAEKLAEAEADRLNAGGEIKLAEQPAATPATTEPQGGGDNLPDA